MYSEDLTGQVTGTQTSFVAAVSFTPDSLRVYVDGIRQAAGVDNDYQETSVGGGPDDPSTGFLMAAPVPAGSTLIVDYDVVDDGVLTASGT